MSSTGNPSRGNETPGVQMLKQVWSISESKPDLELKGKVSTDIYGTGNDSLTVPRRRRNKTF